MAHDSHTNTEKSKETILLAEHEVTPRESTELQRIRLGHRALLVSAYPQGMLMERTCEYNLAIRNFHDSLNGLDSALEEARLRCEQTRRICQEARTAYERTKTQPLPPRSFPPCPERDVLEEQCGRAVIAYGDAVESIQLPPRVADRREGIERVRRACNSVFEALEDHEREHKCTQAKSTRGSAKGKSA